MTEGYQLRGKNCLKSHGFYNLLINFLTESDIPIGQSFIH